MCACMLRGNVCACVGVSVRMSCLAGHGGLAAWDGGCGLPFGHHHVSAGYASSCYLPCSSSTTTTTTTACPCHAKLFQPLPHQVVGPLCVCVCVCMMLMPFLLTALLLLLHLHGSGFMSVGNMYPRPLPPRCRRSSCSSCSPCHRLLKLRWRRPHHHMRLLLLSSTTTTTTTILLITSPPTQTRRARIAPPNAAPPPCSSSPCASHIHTHAHAERVGAAAPPRLPTEAAGGGSSSSSSPSSTHAPTPTARLAAPVSEELGVGDVEPCVVDALFCVCTVCVCVCVVGLDVFDFLRGGGKFPPPHTDGLTDAPVLVLAPVEGLLDLYNPGLAGGSQSPTQW